MGASLPVLIAPWSPVIMVNGLLSPTLVLLKCFMNATFTGVQRNDVFNDSRVKVQYSFRVFFICIIVVINDAPAGYRTNKKHIYNNTEIAF